MTREMAPERGEGLLEESTGVAPSQESTRSPQVILHIKEGDGAIEASAVERSEDDDLTSLSWLQDKNLLKGINLRTSANGGASAGGGSGAGGNIAIADSGGGPTIIVGSNAAAANLNSPVNGGMMIPVKQESPTSDYAEDCPSEQSESTCSSVASGSPVPPHHHHHHHNNNNHHNNNHNHHHQAQLQHLAHQQHHSIHHYQAQSNHSHQSQPQLQQHTLSSNAKNKHPHHIPYDPKVHVTSKPPYSFSCLIFMSIEDSKGKALPVKEIYTWILDHFPYYRNAPTGWKNSVRHNLSLNKCFRKVDKAPNLGKGSLWMVDPVSRPKLVEALMKAPYHPYTNLDKNNSAPNLRKRSPSPDTGAGTQEDELDDVDAAAAMLVLKHGPQARLHISHTREEYHKRQKMALQATPPNGLKIKEEDSVSMAQDHTYSWADTSIEQASADEAFAEGSDSNSSSIRGFCDDEERRKTAEGADALLNLAGITTAPSALNISQPPPLKKFRSSSPTLQQSPLVITSVQYHNERHSHHLDAVNNNNNNNNNSSSVSSGDESGPNERRIESQPMYSSNKLRRKPACPQRIKTKR